MAKATIHPASGQTVPAGAAAVAGSFLFWGVAAAYWKFLAHVDALEVVLHRVVWTAVLTALLLAPRGRWRAVGAVFGSWRGAGRQLLSSAIIGGNWLTFVWAIHHERVVECSMGYFICPLLSVLLGRGVLGERLRRAQVVAALLAGAGVAYLVIGYGRVPWVALTLAGTFGLYGLLRKTSPLESLPGLAADMSVLAVPAAGWLAWAAAQGLGAAGRAGASTLLLLLAAGPVTACPLLLFAYGARRTRLSTVGFLHYLAPTCQLLLGVFAYGEPFDAAQAVTFALIWSGVALFLFDAVRHRPRAAAPEALSPDAPAEG